MNIKATDNYAYTFLTFDDLSVIAPCDLLPNPPNLSMNAPIAICSGQPANMSAAGANTYTWASGPNTAAYAPTPTITTTYSVTGTNTLSGCALTLSKQVIVNTIPALSISSNLNEVCEGTSVAMNASGAYTYTWSTGPNSSFLSVTPNTTTSYTVIGTGAYGCTGSSVKTITVDPLPTISVTGNLLVCNGTNASLTGVGGTSFKWISSSIYVEGVQVSPTIRSNTTFTVIGTDANGCTGTTVVSLVVDPCTGIATINGSGLGSVSIYPNPNNGEFSVELKNGLTKTIDVMDVTGRVVSTKVSDTDLVNLNINSLSNGVYYVRVKSNNAVEVLKVVKQ